VGYSWCRSGLARPSKENSGILVACNVSQITVHKRFIIRHTAPEKVGSLHSKECLHTRAECRNAFKVITSFCIERFGVTTKIRIFRIVYHKRSPKSTATKVQLKIRKLTY